MVSNPLEGLGQVLRNRNGFIQEDVLDRMNQGCALVNGSLEGLATKDQALTPSALVDHGGAHRISEIRLALCFAT